MTDSSFLLFGAALSIGVIHTLLGPDHYVPFVMMAKARGWSQGKTLAITLMCGLGHVLSSAALGLAGIAFGIAVFNVEAAESWRANAASWLLIGFGFAYLLWGFHRAIRSRQHEHAHGHNGLDEHTHAHSHTDGHIHVHGEAANITPWVLFTIFILGPCEPLIPLVMYPAAGGDMTAVLAVVAIFALATVSTMLAVVAALTWGVSRIPLGGLETWSHAMAGSVILLTGVGVRLLGLMLALT